jgi:hypothetical protein
LIHPTVELAKWLDRFSLEQYWAKLDAERAPYFRYYAADGIMSPWNLAVTEQLRCRGGIPRPTSDAVPVDLLLPAFGEPARREVSKIAGLPYMERGAWPRGSDGGLLLFFGQLCLSDSRDLLFGCSDHDLPGDVLLIFQEDVDDLIWDESHGAKLHFEWRRHGIAESRLITAADMPERLVEWKPTHFQRFRSLECSDNGLVQRGNLSVEAPGRYAASKIGGLPVWWQDENEAANVGRYFASIHSIHPAGDDHPFPNVPKPDWGALPYGQNFLMLGDVGTLYLFAKGGGAVGWLMQCG